MIDHELIVRLTRDGWTAKDIAKKVGCSTRTIVRYRTHGSSPKKRPPQSFSPDEISWVEALLEDGCSYTEIARTVGRDATVIAHRWPGRGWSLVESGKHRRLIRKLEPLIEERWRAHLAS